jgi:hypothetical protein
MCQILNCQRNLLTYKSGPNDVPVCAVLENPHWITSKCQDKFSDGYL